VTRMENHGRRQGQRRRPGQEKARRRSEAVQDELPPEHIKFRAPDVYVPWRRFELLSDQWFREENPPSIGTVAEAYAEAMAVATTTSCPGLTWIDIHCLCAIWPTGIRHNPRRAELYQETLRALERHNLCGYGLYIQHLVEDGW